MRRPKHFALERFGVYLVDLPVQNITVPTGNGGSTSVAGSELHGDHPAVLLSVASDGQSAIIVPLTSAKNSHGGEKFQSPKKEWLRVVHQGHTSYILTEQIRMVDRARFVRMQESLGPYDRELLESRLKFLFGIV